MKFKSLEDREIRLEIIASNYPIRTRAQCKSEGQFLLGCQIQKIYGTTALILEEFGIPETRLSLDFYLPRNNIAFEFQGIQHDKFNKFFHGDKSGLERQQQRDAKKRVWCDLNDITLVEVRTNDLDEESLMTLIKEADDNGESDG